MFEELKGHCTNKPNKLLIPITLFTFTEDEVNKFNEYYRFCLENIEKKIVRTRSGGISLPHARGNQYDVFHNVTLVELTIKWEGKWMRIQIRKGKQKKEKKKGDSKMKINGRKAWVLFKKICADYGINVEEYYVSEEKGIDEKMNIPSPISKLGRDDYSGKTFTNVHHLDFNSSYAYGIMLAEPAFEKPIRWLYERRKENEEYKMILAYLHGIMQSNIVYYRLSHIARKANVDNRDRIIKIASKLRLTGRRILMYNTDGIWYQGPIYHDEDEGKDIGQWKNDHVNCKWRAKSDGIYEFIEDGVYHPVYRGSCSYEKIKPREQWEWGDIFEGTQVNYEFIEGEGLKRYENV